MGAILAKAISLILIIGIGYAIKKFKWVSLDDFPKFSKIVLRITLPCALITSFNEFNIVYNLLALTVIGLGVNYIQQLTGFLISRRKGRKKQAFSIINIGSYNIGLFATPYISGFVGADSIIYSSLFDIGNSIGAAGIGYGWAISISEEKEKTTVWRFIKLMFSSPVFDTYLALLIMSLLKIHLPPAVITFTSVVGSANTFLAMLMIGIGLELGLDRNKFKTAFTHLGLRYAFSIIFAVLTAFFIPFPKEVKTVLCMMFFAPLAAMTSGFTSDVGGDVETSAFMTSASIIVGIVAMPLVLAIMA